MNIKPTVSTYPDYANLFDKWYDLVDENYSSRHNASNRRPPSAPILDAGKFAQMLATRCEAQIASDWVLVPAARNLHWRYMVLHNAFCVTKRYATLDPDTGEQIQNLLKQMRWIWEAYRKNTVTINKQQCHINSNFRLLLQDDDITDTAKTILNGWIKTTETVAGCQALRKKIGHILFGFRVVHGDAIFVTVTPNRHNSALLLYLSRTRVNDTYFLSASSSAQYRRTLRNGQP